MAELTDAQYFEKAQIFVKADLYIYENQTTEPKVVPHNLALEFYGLFKVANGEDITTAPPISTSWIPFPSPEKMKRQSWQAVVDKGTTPEEARLEYIILAEHYKKRLGFKEGRADTLQVNYTVTPEKLNKFEAKLDLLKKQRGGV